LTPREREVAQLLERKLSNHGIAQKLGIKLSTVKIHVHNIVVKGGLSRPRSSRGAKTAAGRQRISEAQRRRWQHWRAARSADDT
jgi:DNA-binding NarL/FixJ family response regulator